MSATSDKRPMRADARRNRERILEVAREAFAVEGPDLPLDEIARRAGVSPATLFRHFAGRDELVGAVIDQRFAEQVEPVMTAALAGDEPWQGLCEVIGATVRIGPSTRAWHETMIMAKQLGLVSDYTRERFLGPAGLLLRRAQDAGVVRRDVGVNDLGPIVRMLRALLMTDAQVADDAWQRYLALMLRSPASPD